MAFHDESHVITCDGVVIWEAITKPDVNDAGDRQTWNLRIAVPANAPEVAELQQLVQKALRESTKKGVSVSNPGNSPISQIDIEKFPELPGHVCFSAGTIQGAPPVVDINGADLAPLSYGPKLYNGTVVRLLVHSYAYDNKQRGVNFGLDGVQIIDGNAPRLSVGAAGMGKDAVKAAFGAPKAPAPSAPPAPAAAFPPAGWAAHPTAPGFFFCGQEVLSEPDLRAKFLAAPPVAVQPPSPPAPPAAPSAPPAPHTSYMEPPAPPAPAVAFPPAGWWAHPGVPGSFYNAQNEVLTEAALRARG